MKRDIDTRISPRLYELLTMLHRSWSRYRPMVGWPTKSAGISAAGQYGSFEEWEEDVDGNALQVIETAWGNLGEAHRLAVEMAMLWRPDVWVVRCGSLEDAIRRLETHCRGEGLM